MQPPFGPVVIGEGAEFTDRVYRLAVPVANRFGHDLLDPLHLLLAIVETPDPAITTRLQRAGVDSSALALQADALLVQRDRAEVAAGDLPWNTAAMRVLMKALQRPGPPTLDRLLSALALDTGPAGQLLRSAGLV